MGRRNRGISKLTARLIFVVVVIVLAGLGVIELPADGNNVNLNIGVDNVISTNVDIENSNTIVGEEILSQIPSYSNSPYVVINNNTPFFEEADMTNTSYEKYSKLDAKGRCGVASACIGRELMPTEERESISAVKPTGWNNAKYDGIDGAYLYNRCHLIGFQLSGENANEKNLITGTRYFNVEGMLPFENKVAEYVRETGNHILYRVTPIFEGENLVASGVLMEAKSVEDNGESVQFNVYCYNVQPGINIDYATGKSTKIE